MLANIDVNGDGEVDLWELCRFLVARHDQILGELDDAWALEQAFNLLAVDADGSVSVEELRRIMCMQDGAGLQGVSEGSFNALLAELGVVAGAHGSPHAQPAGDGLAADGTGAAIDESGTGAVGDTAGSSTSPAVRGKGSAGMRVSLEALRRHPAFAPKPPALADRSHL